MSDRVRSLSSQRGALVGAVVALGWIITALRFARAEWIASERGRSWMMADDMYISASFARTLARGGGLVWYRGAPKVEGFSNPLSVLLISFLHGLPGFKEDYLGAYVFAVNAIVLAVLAVATFGSLARLEDMEGTTPPLFSWIVVGFVAVSGVSLCLWCSQGFETGLVACLDTLAFIEALRPAREIRMNRIGWLLGLAFWARMDALVCGSSALLLVACKVRDRKRLLHMVLILCALIASLFAARWLYYGDWLPNTYYLKIFRWPFAKRLHHGLFQNHILLRGVLLLGPLVVFGWRRLGKERRPVLLAFVGPILAILYSTSNGGDFLFRVYGFDRYSAAGSALLILGLSAVMLGARQRAWEAPAVGIWALFVAIGPIVVDYGGRYFVQLERLGQLFDPRQDPVSKDIITSYLVHEGKALRDVLEPGARVAICYAGAIVYFSHRGGVDVLGKVDPYVSHLAARESSPSESRCWREFPAPGHNKEDVAGLFRLRHPDVSTVVPPKEQRANYVEFTYDGHTLYALRSSKLVRWDRVEMAPSQTAGR